MPCVYLPGPAPAVTVANTNPTCYLRPEGTHLGKTPPTPLQDMAN